MKNRISVVTTNRVTFSDLDSENISMTKAMEKYGFEVSLVSWHDLYEQLSSQRMLSSEIILIRTVWDYPQYYNKFQDFIRLLKNAKAITINPPDIIEWNINKKYLFDLLDAGLPIVPCEYIKAGSVVCERNRKSVIKPVVGLGSKGARILNDGDSVEVEVDSLINPFRNSIYEGEISIVMISGNPVLFIRKIPSSSDWRVQPEYGGKYLFESTAPRGAIDLAQKLYRYIIKKFKSKYLLFMRIDMLRNESNDWEILEFEAIDPSLYGAISSSGVDALAHSISELFPN